MTQDKIEKAKTITVNQLYKHIQNSNMMGYIESEAALIRLIRGMTKGRTAKTISFHFVTANAKELTLSVHVKDLED